MARSVFNRTSQSRDKRRNLSSANIRRNKKLVIPSGDFRETVQFYQTSTRLTDVDGGAQKDLDIVFEAKAKIEFVEGSERTFRHVNTGDAEITHRIIIYDRPAARDEHLIKWDDDLLEIVSSAEFKSSYQKYRVFACKKLGDILLEASKA